MKKTMLIAGASLLALGLNSGAAFASDPETDERIADLEARIAQLEETNRRLLEFLESGQSAPATPHHQPSHAPAPQQHAAHHTSHHEAHHEAHHGDDQNGGFVGLSSQYSYRMLDHAEGVNTRQLAILQGAQSGELNNRVTLGGGLTVLANYQQSNSDTKFGWLMRPPDVGQPDRRGSVRICCPRGLTADDRPLLRQHYRLSGIVVQPGTELWVRHHHRPQS